MSKPEHTPEAIGERLRTQDNWATAEPMYCVQIQRRTTGLLTEYTDNYCYHVWEETETYYDDPPEGWDPHGPDEQEGITKSGYTTRWETVSVALTEAGAQEHIDIHGHNLRRQSDTGEVRIYVDSWWRTPEMKAVRKHFIAVASPAPGIIMQMDKLAVLETLEGRIVVMRAPGGYSVMRQTEDGVEAEIVESAYDVYDDIWPEAVTVIANLEK